MYLGQISKPGEAISSPGLVEVPWMDRVQWFTGCSFMCTVHTDMIAHTPILTSKGDLRPHECSCPKAPITQQYIEHLAFD